MKVNLCEKGCSCVPVEEGYYWAADRFGRRTVVLVGKDGFGHTRAYTCRGSSSRDPADFKNYSKRIKEQ